MKNFLYLIISLLVLRICSGKRASEKMLMMVPEKASSTLDDMMAPIMMGILLKLLAMIPMVLVKIGFFALTSLLGSVVSLIVSVGGMIKNSFFPDKKPMEAGMMMQPNMDMMMNKPYQMHPDLMVPDIMHKSPLLEPAPFQTKLQMLVDTKKNLINNFFSQNDEDDLKASSSNYYRFHNGHHEGGHSRSRN